MKPNSISDRKISYIRLVLVTYLPILISQGSISIMNRRKIVMIPGDGIGPNITRAVKRVIEHSGADIEWVERSAGLGALEEGEDVLPERTLDAIKEHKVALKGPCIVTTCQAPGKRSTFRVRISH